MPEGDTVHKLAGVLRQALDGRRLRRLELRGGARPFAEPPDVRAVTALGKHCLLELDNGHVLRVHLGMHGGWSRYRTENAPRPHQEVHLHLETETETFYCERPREVELLRTSELKRHAVLRALGPDLLGPEPDWQRVEARLGQHSPPDRTLGEVLLDQRIAAGLGNVYKNELCFLGPLRPGSPFWPWRGTSPFTPLQCLTVEEVLGLFSRGRELLLANLGGWPRTTTGPGAQFRTGERCWIYGRQRRPCLRCGTLLISRAQGLEARSTCWCPRCQPLGKWGTSTNPPGSPR